MRSRLILNADDFGLTPGINRAMLELHQAGALTSASLMAAAPAFLDAVNLALRHPALGVGCHLVFVDGVPVSPPRQIPSLLGTDGRSFRPLLAEFGVAVLRGHVQPEDLERETRAQIEKLQQAGIAVTHTDTHKHTHCLPLVLRAVTAAAAQCGVRAVRNPFEPAWSSAIAKTSLTRRLQMALVGRFRPSFRTATAAARGLVPAGTLGIAATGTLDQQTLRAMLEHLCADPDGKTWELCCHPGYNDADLALQRTRLHATRELELQALLQVIPEIKQHPNAPEFIHYGNLGGPDRQSLSVHPSPGIAPERVL